MSQRPVFEVDFNELVEPDLVLLSKTDERKDVAGEVVTLVEGLPIMVCEEDYDEHGKRDDLIAHGLAVRNTADDWAVSVAWACRIDARGIRNRSSGLSS